MGGVAGWRPERTGVGMVTGDPVGEGFWGGVRVVVVGAQGAVVMSRLQPPVMVAAGAYLAPVKFAPIVVGDATVITESVGRLFDVEVIG